MPALRVNDLLTDDAAAPAFHLITLLDHRQRLPMVDLLTDDAAAPAFHLITLLDHRQPLSHGTHSAPSLPVHFQVASDNVQHVQGFLCNMVGKAVITDARAKQRDEACPHPRPGRPAYVLEHTVADEERP